jgi:hypothetical protein
MTARRSSWLEVAFLHQLLGDEALVGDLVEECPYRPRSWFWRQITYAVLARAIAGVCSTMREPQRLGGVLTSLAVFTVLGFQAAVSGSLLEDVIQRLDRAQVARIDRPDWLAFVVLLSLPAGWVIGRAMTRLHERSRVATVLVCGASAAVVAAVILLVSSSESSRLVFPSAPLRTGAALAFVLALLVGGYGRDVDSGRRPPAPDRRPG